MEKTCTAFNLEVISLSFVQPDKKPKTLSLYVLMQLFQTSIS